MHNQKHFPSWLRVMKCLVCTMQAPGEVSLLHIAFQLGRCLVLQRQGTVMAMVPCQMLLPYPGVCPQLCVSPFLYSTPFTSTTRWWTWGRSTGFGTPVITRSAACALRSSLRSGARIWMLLPLLWSVDVSSRSSWKRYSGKLKSAPALGSAIAAGVDGRATLSWKNHRPMG